MNGFAAGAFEPRKFNVNVRGPCQIIIGVELAFS
jgi:hypothetical protein